MPARPSLQARRTTTRVWCLIVVMASLCARMVGKSTSTASIERMVGWLFMVPMMGARRRTFQYRWGPAQYLQGMLAAGFHPHPLSPRTTQGRPMHLELRHLRYFAAVARELSFSRA